MKTGLRKRGFSRYSAPVLCLWPLVGLATGEGATNDRYQVAPNAGGVFLDVLQNDTGDLRITDVSQPEGGGTTVNLGNAVLYAAPADSGGKEIFTYSASNNDGAETSAVVVVSQVMAPRQWRIMPIGDSITQADSSTDSYRRPLWHDLTAVGFDVDFVGSQDSNFNGPTPNPDFDLEHEGHWGWRADEFLAADRLPQWALVHQPDVVLLHLGTNDVRVGQIVASTIDELRQIVEILRNVNPEIVVFIARVIPSTQPWGGGLEDLNQEIPNLVASLDAPASPVFIVDQFAEFDASVDTYDGVHPNLAGETKMAAKWFAAVAPYLNEPPVIDSPVPATVVDIGQSVSIDLAAYITDPEGQALDFSAIGLPAGVQIDAVTGRISGVPTNAGSSTAAVVATDRFDARVETAVAVTVREAPDPGSTSPGGGGTLQSPPGFFLLICLMLTVLSRFLTCRIRCSGLM